MNALYAIVFLQMYIADPFAFFDVILDKNRERLQVMMEVSHAAAVGIAAF
jgi:hypothetical protein